MSCLLKTPKPSEIASPFWTSAACKHRINPRCFISLPNVYVRSLLLPRGLITQSQSFDLQLCPITAGYWGESPAPSSSSAQEPSKWRGSRSTRAECWAADIKHLSRKWRAGKVEAIFIQEMENSPLQIISCTRLLKPPSLSLSLGRCDDGFGLSEIWQACNGMWFESTDLHWAGVNVGHALWPLQNSLWVEGQTASFHHLHLSRGFFFTLEHPCGCVDIIIIHI